MPWDLLVNLFQVGLGETALEGSQNIKLLVLLWNRYCLISTCEYHLLCYQSSFKDTYIQVGTLGDTTSYKKRSSKGNRFLPIGTDFDKGKSLVNTWRKTWKTKSASDQFTAAWQTWEHLRVLECPKWRSLLRMPSGIAGCAWGKSAVATPANFLVWKSECTVDMHQYASQISILELMQQMLQWIKFCFDMLNFIWQSDCTLNYCGSLNLNASNIWHRQQRESPALGSHAWSTQWNYLSRGGFQQRAVEVSNARLESLKNLKLITCFDDP